MSKLASLIVTVFMSTVFVVGCTNADKTRPVAGKDVSRDTTESQIGLLRIRRLLGKGNL
jgi:hypothetical protein